MNAATPRGAWVRSVMSLGMRMAVLDGMRVNKSLKVPGGGKPEIYWKAERAANGYTGFD